ncbi:MAG: membrane protein insertase YidC [Bacteroidales bacterium]|nr:membrane protein insertase YidC [Bacteroidales bacterium]
MNKQSIIGLVLIFAIFVGYMFWVTPSKEERAKQMAEYQHKLDSIALAEQTEQALADSLRAHQAALKAAQEAGDSATLAQMRADMGAFGANLGEGQTITVKNGKLDIEFNTKGARVDKVVVNDYRTYDSLPLVLVSPSDSNFNLELPLNDIHANAVNTRDLVFAATVEGKPLEGGELEVGEGDSLTMVFRAYAEADSSAQGEERYIEFVYTVKGGSHQVGFDMELHNMESLVQDNGYLNMQWNNRMNRQEKVDKSGKGSSNRNKDAERFNTSIYYKSLKGKVDNLKFGKDSEKSVKYTVNWIAYKQQFFCAILMTDSAFASANMQVSTDRNDTAANYLCDMGSNIFLEYHGEKNFGTNMDFYFGPSKYHDLRAMHRKFERMIPLGWGFFFTQWISRYAIIPVFNLLEKFNWNYGIIVIVLTFLLRLVLFPLTFKSYQGSAIMRILQPEMQELNKKFPNPEDAMKKQQAMSQLQKKAGYNPMMGCLPALIQLPIIWAMFRFYPASIELRQKSFLWCDDLSTYDSILDFGFNIPLYGDHISLFCLLMFAVQFFYTWYTMKGQSAQMSMPGMKLMMYFMPFMMLFLFNSQSAALNLYYFVSLSLTMIQMILIRQFTSEKKVRQRIVEYDQKHKGKPQKKSKFQQRLEQMQKMAEEAQRQQAKQRK